MTFSFLFDLFGNFDQMLSSLRILNKVVAAALI